MAGPAYVQTATGPVYTRGDQAFLRDRNGKIVTVAAGDAERLLDESADYQPVSAEDVATRDVQIARSTLPEKLKTVAENVAAGAVDVPLAPVRLGLRGAKALGADVQTNPDKLTGRAFTEGVVHDFTAPADESAATEADAAYRQNATERRQVNPVTAGAANMAGQLPWAFVGPSAAAGAATQGLGAGARIAGQVAGGAAEGALFGEIQATDDAYIEDKPLTAEKLMASMGWGALIGGGASLGVSALAEGAGAARGRLGGAGAREAVPDDAAVAFGAQQKKAAQTAAAVDPTDARISQAADSAGLNPAARQQAARAEAQAVVGEAKAVDPTDWRNFTKTASPEAQYLHRGTVLDSASTETARDLTNVLDRQKPIYDQIDNLSIKRDKIAQHLADDAVDETTVIGRAQQEAAGLRSRIDEMRAQVRAQQDALQVGGQAGPVKAGKVKVSGAEKALNEMDAIARAHEGRILAAPAGADAVAEFDSMRRNLARVWRQARGGKNAASYEARSLMQPVSDFARTEYDRAAQALMDDTFVGKSQAAAQRAVNNARVGSINGERFDLRAFVQQVGSEEGADFGGRVYVGNQDSIRSMFEGLGQGGKSMRADQFARFVDSQEATLRAIKENYALSPAASSALDESLASLTKMRGSVEAGTDAANAVNRAKARIEADQINGGFLAKLAASTAVGGIEGGAGGAAKGFARGLLGGAGPTLELQQRMATLASAEESKLAAWLEQKISKVSGTAGKGAAVVNQTAGNVDAKVGQKLDGFFDRLAKKSKQVGEAARRPIAIGKAAAAPTALRLFTDGEKPQEAYRKRTEQLLVMNQNLGAGVRDRTTAALGGISETAPRLTQHVAVAASRGVNYLLAHTPVPLRQPSVMQPGYRPVPSDLEIAQFAKRWAAVADPLTVLDDFQKGMVTYEQVDALKNVYPSLYHTIRVEALQRFQQLDAAGVAVPYQDRLQADLMIDLQGAGDPTLDAGFAIKVSGMMQAAKEQSSQPAPGGKPLNIAKSAASESQAIGATLRGVS